MSRHTGSLTAEDMTNMRRGSGLDSAEPFFDVETSFGRLSDVHESTNGRGSSREGGGVLDGTEDFDEVDQLSEKQASPRLSSVHTSPRLGLAHSLTVKYCINACFEATP
jgi:hypothetical protein